MYFGQPRLNRVSFYRNEAEGSGRGGAIYSGGNVSFGSSPLRVVNSSFIENQAEQGAALFIEPTAGASNKDPMQVLNNTFFDNSGMTQIHLAEGSSPERHIAFANNLVITPVGAPGQNCGGNVDRLELEVNASVSNTQYPGTSCDNAFAKMPVLDLALDLAPVETGGIFDQAYVTENGVAFPPGDASICYSDHVEGIDEFFNARTCKQGAVEAPPKWTISGDYPPTGD